MRLHLIQMEIKVAALAENRSRVESLLTAFPPAPGGLIALPETFSTGFITEADTLRQMDISGEHRKDLEFLSNLARKTGCHILGSSIGHEFENFTNLSLLFDATGRMILEYRKIHPFSLGNEHRLFSGGTQVKVATLGQIHLHPTICYDLRFPELFRVGSSGGAHIHSVQANWPFSRQSHWQCLLQARAVENQAFVFGVNAIADSPSGGVACLGGSQIFDPRGESLALAGQDETVLSAQIDMDSCRNWRDRFPALRDRKPWEFWFGQATGIENTLGFERGNKL